MFLQDHAEIHIYDPKVTEERIYADLEYLQEHRRVDDSRTSSNSRNSPQFAKLSPALIRELVHVQNAPYEAVKKIYEAMRKPAFMFDGRNILNREEMRNIGFELKGIGKG